MTIVREGFSEEMLEIVFEHVESGSCTTRFLIWSFMLNSVFPKNVVCINAAKTTCSLL